MKVAKITIPKINGYPVLYVYRSTRAENINSIEKIKDMQPIAVINWSSSATDEFVFYDAPEDYGESNYFHPSYVEYIGPLPAPIPITEYATEVSMAKINNFTYANVLTLEPLPIPYNGTMYYYSVIGVDLVNNTMTHLSKVAGVLVDCDYKNGSRHIYSCEDYNDESSDNEWTYVGAASWGEDITIGDVNNQTDIDRFGIPVVEKVPNINADECSINNRFVYTSNTMILEITNPWKNNNERFNYRKLKSYKIQNVYNEMYGEFSYPTHQSLLPVPIERITIMWEAKESDDPCPVQEETDSIKRMDIIRKDGIFYNMNIHKYLPLNAKDIRLGIKTALYTEKSINDTIQFRLSASPGVRYVFTIYLYDTYNNVSEPTVYVANT